MAKDRVIQCAVCVVGVIVVALVAVVVAAARSNLGSDVGAARLVRALFA